LLPSLESLTDPCEVTEYVKTKIQSHLANLKSGLDGAAAAAMSPVDMAESLSEKSANEKLRKHFALEPDDKFVSKHFCINCRACD
jgi:hypothetical protein